MFSQASGLAIRDGSKYPSPFGTGALCLSKRLSIEVELIRSSIYNIENNFKHSLIHLLLY